jgi:O-acetylserine/cysteine efflux transporter
MKRSDILLAILVAFAWGSNFIAVRFALIEIPGFLSLAIRFLLTAIILLPFVPRPKIDFRDLYSASLIFGVFYLGLLYYAMHLGLNTSLTIILMQLNIPVSVIIARFVLKEHFTLSSIIGTAIAFIGTLIVLGTPQVTGNHLALIVILFSAFFCAIFNIQNRKFQELPALSFVCWMSLISTPHLFLMSYFIEGNPFTLLEGTTYQLWLALFYSVVVASLLGVTFWIYLLQKYPVYKVLPFNLLVPFFGISLSIMFLGDLPSWHIFLGGFITLCGIALNHIRLLPFLVNKRF